MTVGIVHGFPLFLTDLDITDASKQFRSQEWRNCTDGMHSAITAYTQSFCVARSMLCTIVKGTIMVH